jgi:hypothetical protein
MQVHLAPGAPPRLAEPKELRRFSVIVAAPREALPGLAEAARGVLEFEGSDHAWVSVAWLIEASKLGDWADWRGQLQGMLDYARGKAWTRGEPVDSLRGHVVWMPA